jgi:hypothetical protein
MKKKQYIIPLTTVYSVDLEQAFMQASANHMIVPQQGNEEEEGEDQYLAW